MIQHMYIMADMNIRFTNVLVFALRSLFLMFIHGGQKFLLQFDPFFMKH